MLCRATPRVSEASGDISATAQPCSAMLSVAATSHRQSQVTRRIQRLHDIDARAMMMRADTATAKPLATSFELVTCQTAAPSQRAGAGPRAQLGHSWSLSGDSNV